MTGWGFKDLKNEIPIDEVIEPVSIKSIVNVPFIRISDSLLEPTRGNVEAGSLEGEV
jgi:hypothetical protein